MPGTATPESLFLFALIALLGQAGRVALGTASTVLSHRAAFAILKGIRTDIAAKLSRMPLGSVIETPSGKLKTLIVDTVEKMEVPLAHLLPELTSNLLVPVGSWPPTCSGWTGAWRFWRWPRSRGAVLLHGHDQGLRGALRHGSGRGGRA